MSNYLQFENKKAKIIQERNVATPEQKATKYAREGYEYVQRPAPRYN